MRILGIDPGTRRTGIGIVETQGNSYRLVHAQVVKPGDSLPLEKRLFAIYTALKETVSLYKPERLALENVFYAKDIQATVKIGEARACAMLAASEAGIDVLEYAPTRVKQAVTGNGRATKEQVQHMVKVLLSLTALPQEDAADALAVAICHLHSSRNVVYV